VARSRRSSKKSTLELDQSATHEELKAFQIQLAERYQESNPSKVVEVHWIYAQRKRGSYPKGTSRSGKWLLFVPSRNVDEIWSKIKKAVEDGELGNEAKVATARQSALSRSDARVICVYTYDYEDQKDVMRIRQRLREMGFTKPLSYKADVDTLSGKYSFTTRERISRYYC
jgi:hypothetical protein